MAIPLFCNTTIERAKETWDTVDGKSDAEINQQMHRVAVDFFIGVHSGLLTFSLDQKDRLVVAQRITDMMLNQFSPIAFNDKYAKYGDNYFMNQTSPDMIQSLASAPDFLTARQLLLDAKEELATGKIKLDLSSQFDEKANDQDKSPRVKEENVPTKNYSKDI